MTTLLLSLRYTPDSIALWNAARQMNFAVERISPLRVPAALRDQRLIVYGEPIFASVVAETLGYVLLEPPFDWLTTVPLEYLRRRVTYMNLSEARTIETQYFIKPADDKCFVAQVYASGMELPSAEELSDRVPVLVSEPVVWKSEYRCFVLDRSVAAISIYSRDSELAQADDGSWPAPQAEADRALEFAATVLRDPRVDLPPAVVMDVGVIAGQGWSVIETNPAWTSGLYGCDPSQVLPVIRRACVRLDSVTDADRRWIVDRG